MLIQSHRGDVVETNIDERMHQVDYDAIVVGAGFAGLYMLHRLRQRGLRVLVLEAGSDVGGTWFWNRYPGARCDVESVDYSYSFDEGLEQEWIWSERYATQPEILRYVHHVADRFDLRRDIRTDTRVIAAAFDEDTSTWVVTMASGETLRSRFTIMATGCLSVPSTPSFPGMETFEGEILHTGSWPSEAVAFGGKRVGVIGTGSSGTQLIPIAAEEADELFVFQRTPNFSVPANNAPLTLAELDALKADYAHRRELSRNSATGLTKDMNRVSALAVSDEERNQVYEEGWRTAGFGFILSFSDLLFSPEANQTAVDFLNRKARELIHDPSVAATLTATHYPFGSKRPCVDSNFYTTFNRDNVTLVDVKKEAIEAITPSGVRTSEHEYALDMIVFATGFDAMTGALNKIDIRGRDGALLRDHWAEGPSTYLGLAVSGFPNLLTITGPGSPSVLSNVLVSIEQHVAWIDDLIEHMEQSGLRVVEAEQQAEVDWTEYVDELAYKTLYPVGSSWYLGPDVPGKRRSFMPFTGGLRAYRRKCNEVAAEGYQGFALK
jgi:cation diffusion facilitator CzcD-associated flavoprotein CzcO